ncbi:MAG: hypothetical protein IPP94_15265 [Ignavibacteria bacterium]|nr:hypothetical protein [Ignavibacteria bacterium]
MTSPEEQTPPVMEIPEDRHYMRFSRLNRLLHVLMIVSFISLALTGMSLKFSYTTWAAVMSRFFGGFESAGYVHRFAAAVMIGVFITHIVDLFRRKKQDGVSWRGFIFGKNSMMFNKKDLQDLIASVKWFIGKGERPPYSRWTYWEKFDYFAVFWGMMVIGSTGLTLWFPELFTNVFPGWMINVASIIHSDEALLAVGFIFTVHFFNTHLRPEKFPMDTVIFTGRMSVEELAEDKPAEFAELVESGNLEKNLVEAYPPIVIRAIRFFGWTAVALGLGMVGLIIYGMVFAYR